MLAGLLFQLSSVNITITRKYVHRKDIIPRLQNKCSQHALEYA